MNYLTILKTALSLLPLLIEAIKAVEAAFPEGSNGQMKLELIKTSVEKAMGVADGVSTTFEQLWPTLNSMITGIVGVLNSFKAFKKS